MTVTYFLVSFFKPSEKPQFTYGNMTAMAVADDVALQTTIDFYDYTITWNKVGNGEIGIINKLMSSTEAAQKCLEYNARSFFDFNSSVPVSLIYVGS